MNQMERETATKKPYVEELQNYFKNKGEDVLEIASASLCFPITDVDGNDCFLRLDISIPRNRDGEPFDGYEVADEWEVEKKNREERKKRIAERKEQERAERERKQKERAEKKAKEEAANDAE